MLELVIDDETHERLAVHDEPALGRFRRQVGLGLARERRVVTEEPHVIVGVHENRVERRRVLLAGADHFVATHLLFGFFRDLNWGKRRVGHFRGGAFHDIFHPAFHL